MCDGCHDAPPATASHLKHYGGTVAQAAYGDTRITQDFGASGTTYIFGCGNCHPTDPSRHNNGVVEVELYSQTAPDGSPKKLSPAAASYTPGATMLTDSRGYPYTKGTCDNIYCHSYRSWTTPTGVPNPTTCTPDVPADLVTSTTYKTVTWGGTPLDCAGCHANPPRTRYPANGGAAGDSHSWIGPDSGYGPIEFLHTSNMLSQTWYSPFPDPISCMYCHNDTVRQPNTYSYDSTDPAYAVIMSSVPIADHSRHVNGRNDVAFEKQAAVPAIASWQNQKLTNATYDPATRTCSNIICHPLRTHVKWGTPYKGEFDYDCARCHNYGVTCQDAASELSRQPSISSVPTSTLASPGYMYSYSVIASEPGGGTLAYSLATAPIGMTISPSGVVTWIPTAEQLGIVPVSIVVSKGSLIAIQDFTILSVQGLQPVISSTPVTTATAWSPYSYIVKAAVPSGAPSITSYTLTTYPSGMSINGSGGIAWTPTDLQTGSFAVTVTVSAGSNSSSQSFTVQVAPSPVTFTSTPVTTGATQVLYTYAAAATKPGGGTFTYSLPTKPTGMTIVASTGLISWTPTALQNGSFTVTAAATSGGYSTRQTFLLEVIPSPITITPPAVTAVKVNTLYNPSPNITYSMPGGGTFTYSQSGKPAWMTFSTLNGTISGTPTITGNYTITVTAKKGEFHRLERYHHHGDSID